MMKSAMSKKSMTRRDLLKVVGCAGLALMIERLVSIGVYSSYAQGIDEANKSPFTVIEKALNAGFPVTLDNVLGRPPAIDFSELSTEKRKFIPTACWQCVSRCGAVAEVIDGKIEQVWGNPNLPRSNGRLCAKGRAGLQQVYDPDRLLYPMIRKAGTKRGDDEWERISWDEALDLVVSGGKIAGRHRKGLKQLRDEGHPEQFMFHYGRMKASSDKMIKSYFLPAYGTGTIGNHTAICEGGKWTAQETFWGKHYDINDVTHTNFILNFGCNVLEAHTSHMPFAQRVAKAVSERHVPMYTFDVRLSVTAVKSDEWIPIRPGTDLAVVLAMIHVVLEKGLYDQEFFDKWTNSTIEEMRRFYADKGYTPEWAEGISGVPSQKIRELAVRYATAKPGTIISYRGAIAHYNGIQTERAILLLESLVGYINVKGGRNMAIGAKWKNTFPEPDTHSEKLKILDGEGYALPTHHVGHKVFEMIKDGSHGRPDVYMMYCHNAVYANGNCEENIEVLKNEDFVPFVIAVDTSYGEGTKYADLVLPDATYLERWDWEDMVSYDMIPEYYIRQPIVEPPGEVRDFKDVLAELAQRIGFTLPFESAEQFVRDACEHTSSVQETGGFDYMLRYGAWYDRGEKPHYGTHAKVLSEKDLEGTMVDEATGVIWKGELGQDYRSTKNAYKKYVGQMIDGVPYAGFKPDKLNKSGLLEVRSGILEEKGFSSIPVWIQSPDHKNLKPNELILTTYKVNVQTQSRSQNCAYLTEIYHENPAIMNPETAGKLRLKNGDFIRVTSKIGSIVTKLRVREGVVPGVIAISHHCGHWAYGRYATAGKAKSPFGRDDDKNLDRIWWDEEKTPRGFDADDPQVWGPNGVHPNWIIPNEGDPIAGQMMWMNTPVTVEKVA